MRLKIKLNELEKYKSEKELKSIPSEFEKNISEQEQEQNNIIDFIQKKIISNKQYFKNMEKNNIENFTIRDNYFSYIIIILIIILVFITRK